MLFIICSKIDLLGVNTKYLETLGLSDETQKYFSSWIVPHKQFGSERYKINRFKNKNKFLDAIFANFMFCLFLRIRSFSTSFGEEKFHWYRLLHNLKTVFKI